MWRPCEAPWQYRVLDALPPSVDEGQLAAALAMTPTERLEAMVRLLELGQTLRRARQDRAEGAATDD